MTEWILLFCETSFSYWFFRPVDEVQFTKRVIDKENGDIEEILLSHRWRRRIPVMISPFHILCLIHRTVQKAKLIFRIVNLYIFADPVRFWWYGHLRFRSPGDSEHKALDQFICKSYDKSDISKRCNYD